MVVFKKYLVKKSETPYFKSILDKDIFITNMCLISFKWMRNNLYYEYVWLKFVSNHSNFMTAHLSK